MSTTPAEERGIALTALYRRIEIPSVDQYLATEHAEDALRLVQRGLHPNTSREDRYTAMLISSMAASIAYLLHHLRDLDTGTAADVASELEEVIGDGQALIDWIVEYVGAEVAEAVIADELSKLAEPSGGAV